MVHPLRLCKMQMIQAKLQLSVIFVRNLTVNVRRFHSHGRKEFFKCSENNQNKGFSENSNYFYCLNFCQIIIIFLVLLGFLYLLYIFKLLDRLSKGYTIINQNNSRIFCYHFKNISISSINHISFFTYHNYKFNESGNNMHQYLAKLFELNDWAFQLGGMIQRCLTNLQVRVYLKENFKVIMLNITMYRPVSNPSYLLKSKSYWET